MNKFWQWMERNHYAKMMIDVNDDKEWGVCDSAGEPSEYYTKHMLIGYMMDYRDACEDSQDLNIYWTYGMLHIDTLYNALTQRIDSIESVIK